MICQWGDSVLFVTVSTSHTMSTVTASPLSTFESNLLDLVLLFWPSLSISLVGIFKIEIIATEIPQQPGGAMEAPRSRWCSVYFIF